MTIWRNLILPQKSAQHGGCNFVKIYNMMAFVHLTCSCGERYNKIKYRLIMTQKRIIMCCY